MIFVCFLGRTTLVIDVAAMLDLMQWGVLLVVWQEDDDLVVL